MLTRQDFVSGKQLRKPYRDEQQENRKSFAEKHFATGKLYRLIFGGGEAGAVKVDKWSEGCNNIHAQVTPSTSAKLGGKVMALALEPGYSTTNIVEELLQRDARS